MAQLVAHLHGMQGVRGSSPLSSTQTTGSRPLGRLPEFNPAMPGSSAAPTLVKGHWTNIGA